MPDLWKAKTTERPETLHGAGLQVDGLNLPGVLTMNEGSVDGGLGKIGVSQENRPSKADPGVRKYDRCGAR
jgi:hypothetical protein